MCAHNYSQYYHDHRPSLRPHLHHNSTHSSFFILHSSPSTPQTLYSTILYSTASQTASRHLLLSVPYFVHLSLLTCSSVPPSYSLYSYCLVHPIRLYSSVRLFLAIQESFPCEYLLSISTVLTSSTLPTNLTARVTLHHDDPTMIQVMIQQ